MIIIYFIIIDHLSFLIFDQEKVQLQVVQKLFVQVLILEILVILHVNLGTRQCQENINHNLKQNVYLHLQINLDMYLCQYHQNRICILSQYIFFIMKDQQYQEFHQCADLIMDILKSLYMEAIFQTWETTKLFVCLIRQYLPMPL